MDIDKANEIAMKWQVVPRRQRILLDVDKAEECFKRSKDYLAPNQSRTEEKGYDPRQQFEEFAATHKPEEINAPTIMLSFMELDKPILTIMDGTHRFCVLRDTGVKKMVVGGRYPSWQIAKYYNLLKED